MLAPRPEVAAVSPSLKGDAPPPCAKVGEHDVAPPEPDCVPLSDVLADRLEPDFLVSNSDPCSLHHVLTHLPKHSSVSILSGGEDAAKVA